MIYYLFIFIILFIIINYYQCIEIMANNSDLEWLVVGDIGVFGDNFYKLIRNQKNGNQQFINILGDNFYPNGIDRTNLELWNFIKTIDDYLNIPMYSILGNHDYHKDPRQQIIYNKHNWNMPYYYHYKEYPNYNIGFWYIDTQILTSNVQGYPKEFIEFKLGGNLKSQHLIWLQNTLKESKMKIKIVNGHYPMFSNGNYRDNLQLIKILYPLFKKYNVKVYFAGHDHTFQHLIRTYSKYEVHQFILGSSSEVRQHNTFNRDSRDILIDKQCIIKCSLTSHYLNIKLLNLNNDIIYYYKLKI